ncbi:hypothetical protein ACFVHS_25040 [Streptomyces sp. NPDC057746]|uniref:hypothetical protein n=1 Tax=Streptomyces sp. NPDC057746 TaxID=3346237 RepID=UPI003695FE5A
MAEHASPACAEATALLHLLTARPELKALVWTIGDVPGLLRGQQVTETGEGEIIDACADLMGGTVVRSVLNRDGARDGIAQLVTFYEGVAIDVWASFPLPGADGLTTTELRDLLGSRRLGTLVCLPGGGR